jgi:amino acid adenylation domain-containing protein
MHEVLQALSDAGVTISLLPDGRLRAVSSAGRLTTEIQRILTHNKGELVRLLAEQSEAAKLDEIPRRGGGAELLLSYGQRRMWFLDQYSPGQSNHDSPMVFRLKGEGVDAGRLKHAFDLLVERHESLRTIFAMQEGEPRQVILERLELPMAYEDLSALDEPQRESRTRQAVREHVGQAFDLSRGPLIRVSLLKLGAREHVLAVALHHVISDGWSKGVLISDLVELYRARGRGEAARLPALPIQYADYALWQRQKLQGEYLGRHVAYWRQQLAGAPALLELPTDRPRPALERGRGATLGFALSSGTTDKLGQLCREEGTTLFMGLEAAFALLLSRYSGQHDICVGTPIAGRNRPELEGLIGFFVNTLVLRHQVNAQASFREFLAQTKKTALQAYAHQELPFEQLVEELNPERSLSHAPLFQVMFILQNASRERMEIPGLSIERVPGETRTAKFDLTCTMTERAGRLFGSLEYNTDLFDASTMERLAKHFEVLLEEICARPEQDVGRLGLLTAQEKRQLLVEWNATQVLYAKDKCVHQLFEEQVRRTPEAVALVHEGESLTYGELNSRANRLAHYLRVRGVGPEQLVGVCVERSVEMVVGLLGILKAGGAYVPLDPSYPAERLAYMLADAAPKVLLTQERLLGILPAQQATPPLCLDRDWTLISEHPDSDPPNHTRVENLVYVLYTSGSTGQPKGVALTHAGTAAFLAWSHNTFHAQELQRVALSTSICFDLSVFELFAPLTSGGSVLVLEDALAIERASSSVTLINTVPSALKALLDGGQLPECVRVINLAGEALQEHLVKRLLKALPSVKLNNLYGPSETTTYSTHCSIQEAVSIGRPIANTRLYILDGRYNAVPVGVAGELYIGGDGVGRGYLKRPELTAERFVCDPFSETSGARLYRTGDLARYLPDGNVEYLGRIDQQVKIHGFRIEPGEIEAALLESPGVAQALVLAREDEPGDKRLVAYVVAVSGAQLEPEALRAQLRQKLPEYMVPTVFMVLEGLPLTPNGKVNRKALPAPDGSRQSAKAYVAPRTGFESKLAAIWVEVLKVEKVGIHDNFFELGGHSLWAVKTLSRINREIGMAFNLKEFFEHPTVSDQARLLEKRGQVAKERPIARLERRLVKVTSSSPAI